MIHYSAKRHMRLQRGMLSVKMARAGAEEWRAFKMRVTAALSIKSARLCAAATPLRRHTSYDAAIRRPPFHAMPPPAVADDCCHVAPFAMLPEPWPL